MEGNMLGEGVCWYKNPQICLLVALCRLEIIRLKKCDPLVFEPGAEGSLQFMDHQAAKTIGAHTGAPG